MSKIQDIAERLVKEINESSNAERVEVSKHGNVKVMGEAEFNVKLSDGSTEKVELSQVLPAHLGKKAFRKLDKEISDSGFQVKDPDTLLNAKDFLINKMMSQNNYNHRADDLSMESHNQIGNYYWDKVVSAEKKSRN